MYEKAICKCTTYSRKLVDCTIGVQYILRHKLLVSQVQTRYVEGLSLFRVRSIAHYEFQTFEVLTQVFLSIFYYSRAEFTQT